ncbi:MAG: hypothetical protein FWB77_02225 [Treponema sp.]|nr:hypothetical protein [Treponema sp.]
MKNLFKLFGIIALAAIIGFSLSACDPDDGGGGGGNEDTSTVVPGANASEKFNWLKTGAVDGGSYTINISADEAISPQELKVAPGSSNNMRSAASGIKVTLKGSGGTRELSPNENGALFTIKANVTLVLDSGITLKGRTGNSKTLVIVEKDGALIMNSGATIRDNDYNGDGGGVYVYNDASFTMNGGTITNCTVWNGYGRDGGGVVVFGGGTFTMNNGTITKCSARSGGGVLVLGGIFTMNGGQISENKSLVYLGAAYDGGSGVCVTNDYFYYNTTGVFTMNGGTIANNTSHNTGGGVTAYDGEFYMKGGTISGNESSTGGGVYVSRALFEKTGGTIYGEGAGTNSNVATYNENAGQAVRKDGYSHGGRAKVDATHSAGRLYAGNNTDEGAWIALP